VLKNLIELIGLNSFGIEPEFFLENFISSIICVSIYFVTRFLFLERWLLSYSQLLIAIFLPTVSYLITSIISSNIALSLGMIGALSIVRFRTPVKSPYELVMYFIYITIGITSSVNINLSINFFLFYVSILFLLKFFKFNENKHYSLFSELSDDNSFFLSMELSTNKKFDIPKVVVVNKSFVDGKYFYTLKSNELSSLESVVDDIDQQKIISYTFDS